MIWSPLSTPAVLGIVFLINVIPAFMPPTWIFLASIYASQGGSILWLAILGALFSTMGRFCLAKWTGPLVRRFFGKPMRRNAQFLHSSLEKSPWSKFWFSFFYALSPFPSNAVFILGGTVGLGLAPILAGFFAGRVISYYSLISLASFTVGALGTRMGWLGSSRWVLDLLGIALSIAVMFIDWKKLLQWFKRAKTTHRKLH